MGLTCSFPGLMERWWADACDMNCLMTKPTKWHLRPAKTQISLGIRPVWSESSLCAQWVAKDLSFLHADSEDTDQSGRMPRLIRIFAGCRCHFVGFVMRRLIWGIVTQSGILYMSSGWAHIIGVTLRLRLVRSNDMSSSTRRDILHQIKLLS